MKAKVDRSILNGEVLAPPSKSYTHRAVVMASLAEQTIVKRPLLSADTTATIRACRALGAVIREIGDSLIVDGVKGKPSVPDSIIDVANSGTTLRLLMAVSALCDGTTVLTGDDSIRTRPNTPLIDVLNQLGASVISTRDNGMAPIEVKGPMAGGEALMDGSISSQFFSALLMACPLCRTRTVVKVDGELKSRPYVEITIEMLESAGIEIELVEDDKGHLSFIIPPNQSYELTEYTVYTVPGDFSSASYLLSAGALAGGGITVGGLYPNKQGDAAIIPILQDMGANLEWDRERGEVRVNKSRLTGVTVDVGMTPDLVPTLAVLGALSGGEMVIENAGHVRYKETDRLHAMTVELTKMGVDITEEPDRLVIRGGGLHGAWVSGWHDHRIVMALSVAGMVAGDTIIDTAESVDISYPGFFEAMKSLGGDITLE
ncbi:MAG: 3-phosphoshikimate 1-carboxyvinyltransferase [Candidatus Methanocomedens sp.]|nr:MAG: 3-phosphoshikimate 1-carboxyvinyltransferase [ANME-2 cluster archaeon]